MSTVALSTFKLQARNWHSVVAYPVLFISLQFVSGSHQATDAVPITPLELAVVEALKLASNAVIRHRSGEGLFRKSQGRTASWDAASQVVEEQPLQGLASEDSDGSVVSSSEGVSQELADANLTTWSCLAVVCASAVWASAAYVFSSALYFFDVVTLHLAAAVSTVFVLYGFYAFAGQRIGTLVIQSTVLPLLGVSLAKVALSNATKSNFTSPLVLLSVTFTSACNVFIIHNIYHSHTPITLDRLNTLLFSCGLCFHVVVCFYQALFTPTSLTTEWTLHRISALIIRALLDWTVLSVIRDHDAILERVLYSLSLALLLLIISALNVSFSLAILAGSSVALWASISYVSEKLYKSHHSYDTPENESSIPTRRRRTIAGTIFAVLGIGSIIGATEGVLFHSPRRPTCQRRPLHFSPPPDSDGDSRTYTHFDNVLLIVFFSHARYDTNLDFYRDVYADYFPNILFIGPANREDAGFEHSYDVLVDTYQAAEDLSNPDEYKMGGRLAHHMLYTAMLEHPCYDGYLWAPFDTLLNVPRLQLFDQSRFWYHSPFGRYVPNPALDPSAMNNASYHAPPANISPDPADMPPWKGWLEDWWWGSPYVGLPVCMPAFNNVSEAQRDRLAALTGQHDRFIGGSADTMYIPGRHRDTFMSVLALFLQTDCFLEIAAPTALHLALPRDEDILYIDHWWIWQPPFDTEFVRGKWAEGREVDTFHAFHWGEPMEVGGVWEPRPERIEDVRRLLRDSAARQGIRFPKGNQ